MAQDTLLGFPAHTLPFRCGESTSLSTASLPGCCRAVPYLLRSSSVFASSAGKQAGGQLRLLRGVSGGPHLHQQRTCGGVLIVPGIPQKQRPHQRGIVRQRLLLHRHRQSQILHPVGMAQSAAVAAHDEGELRRCPQPLDLRHHLHLTAVGRLDSVPVDIQHEADRWDTLSNTGRSPPESGHRPRRTPDSHTGSGHGARRSPPEQIPLPWRPPCEPHCTGSPWCGGPRTRRCRHPPPGYSPRCRGCAKSKFAALHRSVPPRMASVVPRWRGYIGWCFGCRPSRRRCSRWGLWGSGSLPSRRCLPQLSPERAGAPPAPAGSRGRGVRPPVPPPPDAAGRRSPARAESKIGA